MVSKCNSNIIEYVPEYEGSCCQTAETQVLPASEGWQVHHAVQVRVLPGDRTQQADRSHAGAQHHRRQAQPGVPTRTTSIEERHHRSQLPGSAPWWGLMYSPASMHVIEDLQDWFFACQSISGTVFLTSHHLLFNALLVVDGLFEIYVLSISFWFEC